MIAGAGNVTLAQGAGNSNGKFTATFIMPQRLAAIESSGSSKLVSLGDQCPDTDG
jgi:hypothetical protein